MITTIQRKSYKETLIILNKLELTQKIPLNIIEKMKKEQDNNWNFKYDENLELKSQKILKNTAELLSVLYLKYICNNDNERKVLKSIYEENEKREKYILKDKKEIVSLPQEEKNVISKLPIERKTFKEKVLEFFKNFLKNNIKR